MKSNTVILILAIFSLLLGACIPIDEVGESAQLTPLPTFSPPPTQPDRPTATTSQEQEPTETAAEIPITAPTTTAVPEASLDYVEQFPDPGAVQWRKVVDGLDRPVSMANAGDGSGRLFILEQPGRIQIVSGSELQATPFLDITNRVGSSASEQGLLGLAFHPEYSHNGYFYVNYTDRSGDTSISRFRVSADPNVADPASELQLLQIDQPYGNHNGGVVAFGPDGYLYLGLGDGGSGGDPQGNGQSLNTLLGKILRIDVDSGEPYAIPSDNPFASGGGAAEIWAYGLRNPWRFSFDRLTGDFYIADVGQNSYEELNVQPAGSPGGENYGWNTMEGFECFSASNCDKSPFIQPVLVYPTRSEGTCSITGGYVYRGQALPAWQGVYLYGDYCAGRVWGLLPGLQGDWQQATLFETGLSITSFGQDESGELYLLHHRGELYSLEER